MRTCARSAQLKESWVVLFVTVRKEVARNEESHRDDATGDQELNQLKAGMPGRRP